MKPIIKKIINIRPLSLRLPRIPMKVLAKTLISYLGIPTHSKKSVHF